MHPKNAALPRWNISRPRRVYSSSSDNHARKGGVLMRVLLGLALLFLLIQPTQAQALSCASLPSPKEAYQQYDAVLVGSVRQVESDGNVNRVQVTVASSYKGVKQKELTVLENATWGAAWGPSVVGETYLFYLKHTADGWENPLCAPSRRIADAQDDLAFLQNKVMPVRDASGQSASASPRATSGRASYAAVGSVVLIVLAVAGIGWTRGRRT